jgi:hypothetical protein
MAQLLPGLAGTSLIEPKFVITTHSGLELTQLIAVCHKSQSLGPKEFIAYTEELAELVDGCQLGHHLYADDSQLVKKYAPLTSHPPSRLCSNASRPSKTGVRPNDCSSIHQKLSTSSSAPKPI